MLSDRKICLQWLSPMLVNILSDRKNTIKLSIIIQQSYYIYQCAMRTRKDDLTRIMVSQMYSRHYLNKFKRNRPYVKQKWRGQNLLMKNSPTNTTLKSATLCLRIFHEWLQESWENKCRNALWNIVLTFL